jgi:hypothetical protein
MPPKFKLPYSPYNLPWFLFDIQNLQLITTASIPSSNISDTKEIVLAEQPIPGLNYNPIQPGGGGNRKISFTIPLVKRNNTVGNVLLLKQFDNLRNQAFGLTFIFRSATQFTPTPKVLYYWGTGSMPLEYYVKKCDFVQRSQFVNRFGIPQFSEISIELWLDESSLLYKGEEVFRKLSSYIGMFTAGLPRQGATEAQF